MSTKSNTSKRAKKDGLSINILSFLITLALIAGTLFVYYLSKGYRVNIGNGEIEKTGVLNINTSPRRAKIYIDGDYKGTSPKAVAGIGDGMHQISIEKDGFFTWETSIEVIAEQSIPIYAPLFLKKPQEEIIFDLEESNSTEGLEDSDNTTKTLSQISIDTLQFSQNQKVAVFTVMKTYTDELEDTQSSEMEIWSYKINSQFWQADQDPRQIATISPADEDLVQNDISRLDNYEIQISPDGEKILLTLTEQIPTSTNESPTTNSADPNSSGHNSAQSDVQSDSATQTEKTFYLLDTGTKNSDLEEITVLSRYPQITPRWSQDSNYLIFAKDNELRSFNISSQTQIILAERDINYEYKWSTQDNFMYMIEPLEDNSFIVSKTRINGEKKEIIVDTRNTETSTEDANQETDTDTTTDTGSDFNPADTDSPTNGDLATNNQTDTESSTGSANEPTNTETTSPTLAAMLSQVKRVTDIHLVGNEDYLIFTTPQNIIIHDLQSKEEIVKTINASNPQFIAQSPQKSKFIYTTDENKLYQYTLEIEEGDPIHTVGNMELLSVENINNYNNFTWLDGEGFNIAFTQRVKSTQQDPASFTLKIFNTESRQIFKITENLRKAAFATSNDSKEVVNICDEDKICRITFSK